jgi:hypothetical protein
MKQNFAARSTDRDAQIPQPDPPWFLPRGAAISQSQAAAGRHTAATLGIAAGVSVKVISDQLGHASISFTLQGYSHVLPSIQDEAL